MLAIPICSCGDKCRYLECAPPNTGRQFRIVSATNGKDLVFGTGRMYNKNQIKFYTLKGSDTSYFFYSAEKYPGVGFDSLLSVSFYPEASVIYMRLSNGDVDTFSAAYTTPASKCCSYLQLTNLRFNNSVNIPVDSILFELKK